MKNKNCPYWIIACLLLILAGGGGTLFCWMPRTPLLFYGGIALLTLAAGGGFALLARAKGKKPVWLRGLLGTVAYLAVLAAVTLLCDHVLFPGRHVYASLAVTVLNLGVSLALILAFPKKADPKASLLKKGVAVLLALAGFVLSGLTQNYWWGVEKVDQARNRRLAEPVGFSAWTEPEYGLVTDADFYVSPDGSDENDGSFSHPFATLEKARDSVRALDRAGRSGITVAVKAGEYRVNGLTFTREDGGTESCPILYCAYGDGEVILNAGMTLAGTDFAHVTDPDVLARLARNARDKVLRVDLRGYGVTPADYGPLHALGQYTTNEKYDGYPSGSNTELFVDGLRQTLARYPNEGWLYTGRVIQEGEPAESNANPHLEVPGWQDQRNPKGDTYALEPALARRIAGWADLGSVWMWGHFSTDWCFETSPIGAVDLENLTIYNKFVARYGAEENAAYFFYNVLEELDAPGEWYLDREAGVLYLYAPDNLSAARILLTLSEAEVITVRSADWLTLRGFTIEGTRGNGVSLTGDHLTLDCCRIRGVGGGGVYADGSHNLVSNNEITRTGAYGVELCGGDPATLTPGESRVYNNLIHHWGEADGFQGIRLRGVGNLADHNELHHYADVAINFTGNNHVIEYNLIHDVSLESSDAAAIYTGTGSACAWSHLGSVIRYNAVYNMGQPGFSAPNGIYLDDVIMGQTVYGNLLVNVPDNGILIGGGRNNQVWGNVIVNTGNSGVSYDQRAFHADFYSMEALWADLTASPWQTEAWQTAYPFLLGLHMDGTRKDDPLYAPNPAGSRVCGNLLVNWQGSLGDIDPKPAQYSDFSGNAVFTLGDLDRLFLDPSHGDYRLKEGSAVFESLPDFAPIPVEKIGRE
ncbi:MAG: right-handed parallel beta-helix repeat-containing protein [Lachnospiraceae bacterium]|nr:right-handed parallel beta-helix repeat-containing protein [Lachnospiraceae bacterium]